MAGAGVLEVSDATFDQEVLRSEQPVLVDFWAEWCGPCKMVAPIVDQIASEYGGKLRVVKVNVDANPDLLTQYGVMGIPTLLLMKDGEPVERIAGYQSKVKILSKLASHI